MGKVNSDLIRAAEQAKRKFGKASLEYLEAEAAVEHSQAVCPHRNIRRAVASKDSSKVKAGDLVRWCVDCALPLELNGVPWKQRYPRLHLN